MRVLPLCLVTLLLAAPDVAAATPHAHVTTAGAGSVRVLECSAALDPAARSATFEGRMRAQRGSVAMAMRFTLQLRTPAERRWRRQTAEGFDAWLPSQPAVRRYTYAKTVRGLPVPASYRVLVRFRWLDEEGAVVARSQVVSAACLQPDLRPDLVARRLDVGPGPDPALDRYAVLVRNAGGGAAGASAVRLDVPGRPATLAPVPPLAAGESRRVVLTAPACAAGAVVAATVDATAVIAESDEAANVISAACPS
jgi:hypothetical protein